MDKEKTSQAQLRRRAQLKKHEPSIYARLLKKEKKMTTPKQIGDNCVKCGKSTAWGSGIFVNRVPAYTDELEGYMCSGCQGLQEEEEE